MKPLKLHTPKVPALIAVADYDGRSSVVSGNPPQIHIADLTDEQLRNLGQRWTEQLLKNAQSFRDEWTRIGRQWP